MAGELQPLDQKFAIVDLQGRPTDYFTRWAQQRQIDISGGITADQAQELINDFAAARQIIAGRALDGGGFLSGDVTIDHAESLVVPGTYGDATHVPQFVVDQEGHIQGVVLVPITGGGGGSTPWAPWTKPAVADFTLGNAAGFTLSDDTGGAGIVIATPAANPFALGGIVKPAPAAPFNVYAHFDITNMGAEDNARIGIHVRNSTSGRISQFGILTESSSNARSSILHWNTYTSYSSDVSDIRYAGPMRWLRLENDGTNLNLYFGNGYKWFKVRTETIAAWVGTVNEIGFAYQNTKIGMIVLNSFSTVAPVAGGGGPAE